MHRPVGPNCIDHPRTDIDRNCDGQASKADPLVVHDPSIRKRAPSLRGTHRSSPNESGALAEFRQEGVEVELISELPEEMARFVMRPFVDRPIPHQLDVIAVRVAHVDRQVGTVICGLTDRPIDRLQTAAGIRERSPRRVRERHVVQSRDAVRLWTATGRLPRVEAEVVVIAAGRDEQKVACRSPAGHIPGLRYDVKAEHVDVEPADTVDVGGAQMDVTDPHTRIDRIRTARDRCDVPLLIGHAEQIIMAGIELSFRSLLWERPDGS